jgi:hypothetical protein
LIDISSARLRNKVFKLAAWKYFLVILFAILISINIYQADEATKPGRIYRSALFSVLEDVKIKSPPKILVESWIASFMQSYYLNGYTDNIEVTFPPNIYDALEYENWLLANQYNLPNGSMMITGIGGCVFYNCYNCGFQIVQFRGSLDPHWQLYGEYRVLTYLPEPETVRLWVWKP